MALEPTSRLSVNASQDLRALPLTPQEFFLISRVEAIAGSEPPTLSEVVSASGLPEGDVHRSIARLIELGALCVEIVAAKQSGQSGKRHGRVEARIVPQPSAEADDELRARARERRRSVLEAQMRALRRSGGVTETDKVNAKASAKASARPSAEAEEAGLPKSKLEEARRQAAEPAKAQPILERVSPVGEGDPRLQPAISIAIERQRRLLAVRDDLRRIGHFELLGMVPVDDEKAVRRAFHVVSRDFHPDNFYGKELGSFREVLDDLFRRARASYDFLMDAAHRRALVDAHQEQQRAEQEAIDRDALARRRVEQEAIEREEARRAAEAQVEAEREAQRAQELRDAREARRRQQLRDQALLQRRMRGRDYARQAEQELARERYGTAATLFRLAHEHDPGNEEYERRWRETLSEARKRRAETGLARGRELRKAGHLREAARALAEAADADPSLANLTEAMLALCEVEPNRARGMAIMALEVLQQAGARGLVFSPGEAAAVHQACARAFLSAGQLASAKEQAERAHTLAPSSQTRTLLNAIKLT
ncbi:hypothetical protein G6O69_30045 [Pseudenhygromyxa sp. WMMC2535]|uniref:hypothetical protein n=1 Tax=Pseudenhygromyxa sp. WMMC2535 TaxID=2712867 RepID=UPI0015562356|nr:hypothetical protein [Pseudenhygromyxa sp. WMMC2535]NVB42103.1 hypothetical protein [Pseudenhygromyxa sp. WMMC2535]